jgi:hypothetical protein
MIIPAKTLVPFSTDAELALVAVLLAAGPVQVLPRHATQAATASVFMEHDPGTDSWRLHAVPADQAAPDLSRASVGLPGG